jgi:hypothetical protein
MSELFIGLMSGTSLDGVDGVIVDFGAEGSSALRVLAHAHRPFASSLASELLSLNAAGDNELHRAALAGNALARLYAQVVEDLVLQSDVSRAKVHAIGAHGQTVRHRPREFDGTGYTIQLNNPALLAELCGIDVVADLRSRDLVAGGQGAPLVPAFHRAVFGRPGHAAAVLNVGGISNLTSLRADGTTIGFDCGPGNTLMDLWCAVHTGQRFDDRTLFRRLAAQEHRPRPISSAVAADAIAQIQSRRVSRRRAGYAGGTHRVRLLRRCSAASRSCDRTAGLRRRCLECPLDESAGGETAHGAGHADRRARNSRESGRGLRLRLAGPGVRAAFEREHSRSDRRHRASDSRGPVPGRLTLAPSGGQ